ncbi:MAG: ATP-binding protein [Lachnospiraceae bacterium]
MGPERMDVWMEHISRKEYEEWLIRWKDQQIIKVVSGVRRCGKSTLFSMFRELLRSKGVQEAQIIDINFEDLEYEELTDYKKCYLYIKERLASDRMHYIFLDEVQHLEHFEKVVDSLFIKKNCDVYMTGSNAYFMSGELATLLSGRYVELNMLPLSFKEFSSSERMKGQSNKDLFGEYLRLSSFPYLLQLPEDSHYTQEYLENVYNTVLLKDVVARLRISDVNSLERVAKFMFHNIGNKVTIQNISNTLKSAGKGVDHKTVDKYIRGLTDSLVLYEANRYNIKGKQFLTTQSKYYAVDVTLRNMLVRGKESDIGHILENIVYLELLRRGFKVYVGEIQGGEVDFVAVSPEETIYYQVAATTLDEQVLKRELASLEKIPDHYPKYLLTLDEIFGAQDYNGIKKRNVLQWLLE